MTERISNPNNTDAALHQPKVGVVVVNWNGRRFLADCLSSLVRSDYPTEQLEIILVDNASTDGSADWAEQNFKSIKVIRDETNLGFAAGNNQGIRWALDQGAEFVVVLNYDTVVEPGWLIELVRAAESDRRIGSVQSLVLLHGDPQLVNTSGNQLHYLGFGYCGQYRSKRQAVDDRIKDIAYGSGTAVLYRAAALRAVGLFDEDLFMYHEDLDLGWRLRLAGYRNVIAPQSIVYHKYSFSRNPKKFFYLERNRQIVLLKNYRLWTLCLLIPPLVVMEVGLLAYSLVGRWFIQKLAGYDSAFKQLANTLRKRRQVQGLRKASDRTVVKSMTSTIEFEGITNPILKWIVNPMLTVYWYVIKWLIF